MWPIILLGLAAVGLCILVLGWTKEDDALIHELMKDCLGRNDDE